MRLYVPLPESQAQSQAFGRESIRLRQRLPKEFRLELRQLPASGAQLLNSFGRLRRKKFKTEGGREFFLRFHLLTGMPARTGKVEKRGKEER